MQKKKNHAFKKYELRGKIFITIRHVNHEFAFSQWNIRFVQRKNIVHLKISVSKKFILQQIVSNFADFWQNNSISEKKKIAHVKILALRKVHMLTVNPEFYWFLAE